LTLVSLARISGKEFTGDAAGDLHRHSEEIPMKKKGKKDEKGPKKGK
jgi:hypothetical protein